MKRAGIPLIEYEMWRYRYIVLFMVSLTISVFILASSQIDFFLGRAGEWGYLGAFVTGVFYTHSVSSPPAAAVFFELSKGLNPFIAAAIGGVGAMFGDLLIFRFFKNNILPEARLLAKDLKMFRIKSKKVLHVLHEIAPFLAGFIIASPLPDEIGAALFGAIEYDTKKFLLFSWCCNSAGLLAIALLGKVF